MIKRVIGIVILLIILLFAFVAFLGGTNVGLRTSIYLFNHVSSAQLKATNLQGQLFSNINAKNISYTSNNLDVRIATLQLHWSLLSILDKKLDVSLLHADNIVVNIKSIKEKKKSIEKEKKKQSTLALQLPIQFSLKNTSLTHLDIQQDGITAFNAKQIKLNVDSSENDINIEKLSLDTKPYYLQFYGVLALNKLAKTTLYAEYQDHQNKELNFDFKIKGNLQDKLSFNLKSVMPNLFSAQGTLIKPLNNGNIAVKGQWKRIMWPRKRDSIFILANGYFKVTGSANNYSITGHSKFFSDDTPELAFDFAGKGNKNRMHFTKLELSSEKSHAIFNGEFDWRPTLRWEVNLVSSHFNTHVFIPLTTSDLSVDLHSAGQINKDGHSNVEINLKKLQGQYDNHVIQGQAFIHANDGNIDVKKLNLRLGKNLMQAQGHLNNKSNFHWKIAFDNVEQIHPSLRGNIYSQGQINGNYLQPTVVMQTEIPLLIAPDLMIKNAYANTNFDSTLQSRLDINATASMIHYKSLHLHLPEIKSIGNKFKHQINISSTINNEYFSLQSSGFFKDKTLTQTLQRLSLQNTRGMNWRLKNPARLTLNANSIHFKNFYWFNQNQHIAADLQYDASKNWHSKLNIQALNLNLLNPFLDEALWFNTNFNANLDLQGKGNHKINGHLKVANKHFATKYYINSQQHHFYIGKSQLNAVLSAKNGLNIESALKLTTDNLPLAARLQIDKFDLLKPTQNQNIKGFVNLNWPTIKSLQFSLPWFTQLAGSLKAQLNISGKLHRPLVSGNLTLQNALMQLQEYGLNITDINIHSQLDKSRIDVTASAKSQGTLKITGHSNMDNPLVDTDLHGIGSNVQVFNTKHYKINLTPDIHLIYSHQRSALTGKVTIASAFIRPPDFSSTTTLPDTFVILDTENTKPSAIRPLLMKLNVTLGKKIHVYYQGLAADLTGKLKLTRNPQGTFYGNGALKVIDGSYRAYGKALQISRGEINYNNSTIDNPNLNVLATTTIPIIGYDSQTGLNSITVGVRVAGNAQNPIITLYSQPLLSDTNILSYLLFGRQSTNEGGNGDMLAAAIAMLASGEDEDGGFLLQTQRSLGLSEFGFQTGQLFIPNVATPQTTQSFVIGKKLTKRIEAQYSIGLNLPINVLTLRYNISHQWQLQLQNSNYDTGGDLLYTIETD